MNVSMVKDVMRGATLELGTLIIRYHNVVCVSTLHSHALKNFTAMRKMETRMALSSHVHCTS